MKKKIILTIVTLLLVLMICFFGYLFNSEYQSYKTMYQNGKVTGTTFVDCDHTKHISLDYSSSMATREPVAVSPQKLKEIHSTAISYMFCCGHIQEKLGIWGLQMTIIAVPSIIVVSAFCRKEEKQSEL